MDYLKELYRSLYSKVHSPFVWWFILSNFYVIHSLPCFCANYLLKQGKYLSLLLQVFHFYADIVALAHICVKKKDGKILTVYFSRYFTIKTITKWGVKEEDKNISFLTFIFYVTFGVAAIWWINHNENKYEFIYR